MTLDDAIRQLNSLDENLVLCARKPWLPSSECVATPPSADLGVPRQVKEAGLDYFLEVDVAREVLGALGARPVSHEDNVKLLIHYAEHDAYPDWVYGS